MLFANIVAYSLGANVRYMDVQHRSVALPLKESPASIPRLSHRC